MGLRETWRDINEVDSHGNNELGSIVGITIIVVLGMFTSDGRKVISEMVREWLGNSSVVQRVQATLLRRFDSRMSRASGVDDQKRKE